MGHKCETREEWAKVASGYMVDHSDLTPETVDEELEQLLEYIEEEEGPEVRHWPHPIGAAIRYMSEWDE